MGKKAPKASRKLAAKGELKRQIQERHKHQRLKKRLDSRKAQKAAKVKSNGKDGEGKVDKIPEDDSEKENDDQDTRFKGMSVDDFLGAGFMDAEGESAQMALSDEDSEGQDSEDGDNVSFASVDELSDEGEAHLHELSQLAQKDPEFYKYLQENDQELLEFDPNTAEDDDPMEGGDDGDAEDAELEEMPILTKDVLKSWQKALLEQRSLRALRKLLVAFRSAAHIQDESDEKVELAWRIDSPVVFRKLVTTALRYTPVVLDHHIPYKTLPDGKFKQPVTSKKFTGLTKLLLSHFHNAIRLIASLPQHSSSAEGEDDGRDVEMTVLALSESAKLLPYIVGSRKAVKVYLKTCLNLWSLAQDNVRIAAFLAIRRLAASKDESVLDLVLKGVYLTLVRSCKVTSMHSLPSITLMKNSASELYCTPGNDGAAYQHAFGYIRQLAILLRGGMKTMTKDAYKQVYNWQFVHCVDFWTLVLARACGKDTVHATPRESELQALVYPLVQVSLGAIQLLPTPRSYPYHLHLLRSLLHLSRHTTTYIPFAPYLLPILQYSLSPSTSGKSSTLRPLPLDTTIRAPAPYLRTRIYAETLADEVVYVFAEWMGTPQVQGSIAFPEICVPIGIVLKKSVKGAKGVKQAGAVKMLVERMEESAKWMEQRRQGVTFAPADVEKVRNWQEDVRQKLGDTPLGKALKLLRKTREKRVKLLEKAREGENEILDT